MMETRQRLLEAAKAAQLKLEEYPGNETFRAARDEAFWEAKTAGGVSAEQLGVFLLMPNQEVAAAMEAHVQHAKAALSTEAAKAAGVEGASAEDLAERERLLQAASDAQGEFAAHRNSDHSSIFRNARREAFWAALQHDFITEDVLADWVGLSKNTVLADAGVYDREMRRYNHDRNARVSRALFNNLAKDSSVTLKLADGTTIGLTITALTESGIDTEQGVSIIYGNPYAIDKDACLVYIGQQGYARFEVGGPWVDIKGAEVPDLEDIARSRRRFPEVVARFDAKGGKR